DIHNGPTTGAEGGVGGLVGYCGTTGPLTEYPTVARSFTTGRINSKHDAGGLVGRINAQMTWQDCFSTAALGVTAKNSPSVDLLLSTAESIGGLIGNNQAATTLSNVYFAGGLLAPQFGSIVGQQGNTLTLTNTVVDGTQTPQDAAKYAVAPITASYDLGAFVTQDMGDAWDADPAYLPQLGWASESISDTVKGLSHSAAKRWFTPDVTNSVMGSDGTYSLYRLKDVSGAAPDKLGAAENILTRTRNLKSGNVIIGGIYTGATPVSGTSIPAARWAVTAANQTEGSANVIDTGTNLLRFLDRVNLAGGGYLGADFTLSGTISGTAIPAYAWTNNTTWSGSTTFPFCGKLTGGAGSALSKLNYSTGATGLFNTAFKASFQDLMFKDISIGNIKLGNSSSVYFGLLAGRMASSSLNNVDINGFSYACQDSYTLVPSATLTPTPIGLVGTIPSTGVSANFTDCDVTGLAIDIKAANVAGSNLVVYVGGLVGSSASSSISITNCTVSGSISATLTADSTVESTAHVGGFIGYASGNSGNIKVTGGRVIANLVGGTVGGLIGRGRVETLTNCL
ncbi:hypothetical protein, partial [Lutispora sp.]|uniref:hypothetical protein n=1 Tax=Lutispora sp. TaxID=2828727 RepID=UPI002B21DBEF